MVSDTLYTDKQLFLLIAEGDEAAFGILFHRYIPQVQPVIARLTGSGAITKDIIQDTFLSIWIDRQKLSDIQNPSDWIFRIVYNKTYTWLEQQQTHRRIRSEIGENLQAGPLSNPTEESLSFSETSRLVRQAIHRLPPQTQKIYRLSREQGLKNQEIAAQLGLSPQTIKNTLTNAAKSIKTYLAEKGIVLPLSLILYWLS